MDKVMSEQVKQESHPTLYSVERENNGTIKVSFDTGSSASAFWLTEDEALELISQLLDSVNKHSKQKSSA
jgi:hypothetical protein